MEMNSKKIRVGIDAINLHQGGGMTHILNILNSYIPEEHNVEKITIWAKSEVLDKIPEFSWLDKKTNAFINKGLLIRYLWIFFYSKVEFLNSCDILFSPGGLYFGGFKPFVSMSRNMLLFDKRERKRLKVLLRLKILMSKYFQITSFKKASGIIFISNYSYNVITNELNLNDKYKTIVYHGVSDKFRMNPSLRSPLQENQKIKILYVSHIYEYKHPWNVVESVKILNDEGYDVDLDIIGGGDESAIAKLYKTIKKCDPNNTHINYLGIKHYNDINQSYKDATIFVYASTCENMPNILIEAMSSGLPIACSKSAPMPEFLKDAGVYFDAEKVEEIVASLERLINSAELRICLSKKSYDYSMIYNWSDTSKRTFDFIESVYVKFSKK